MKAPDFTRYRVRVVLDEYRWKLPVAAAFLGTPLNALLDLVLADARWRRLPSGRTTPPHPWTLSTPEMRELLILHGWVYRTAARTLHVPEALVRARALEMGLGPLHAAAKASATARREEEARRAVEAAGGSVGRAARALGISHTSVRRRLCLPGYRRPRKASRKRRTKLMPTDAQVLAALRDVGWSRCAAAERLVVSAMTVQRAVRRLIEGGAEIPPDPHLRLAGPHAWSDAEVLAALRDAGWSRSAAVERLAVSAMTVRRAVQRLIEGGEKIPPDPALRGPRGLAARVAAMGGAAEERRLLHEALIAARWDRTAAACALGVSVRTVYRRSRALGIGRREDGKRGGVRRQRGPSSRKTPARAA